MDYEQKYKSALAWMQSLYPGLHGNTREEAEKYFPELAESEDERIRKELIAYCQVNMGHTWHNIKQEDYVAWLEKQGESSDQIHYWTEEEIEPIISDYLRGAEHYGGMIARLRCLKPKYLEKQGEQKPAEWSEEDEKKLNRIYTLLAEAADKHAFSKTCRLIGDKECVELQDFLRSLRPQASKR